MIFDISSRIKDLRKHFGISANKLSKELNISQPALSKIENNKSIPSWNLLQKICDIFNLSFSDFFESSFFPESVSISKLELDDDEIELQIQKEIELLGKRIKYLRESSLVSRNQFESIFKISKSYISRIENGKNPPQLDLVIQICDFFNISISNFFSLDITNLDISEKISVDEEKQILDLKKASTIEKYAISFKELNDILKIRKFSDLEKNILNAILNQYEDEIHIENF